MSDLNWWLHDQQEEVESIYADVTGHNTPPGSESAAYSALQQFVEDYS